MSTQKIPMTEIEYNAELLLPKNCSISQLGHFSRTEAGCVTSALYPTPDVQSGIAGRKAKVVHAHRSVKSRAAKWLITKGRLFNLVCLTCRFAGMTDEGAVQEP